MQTVNAFEIRGKVKKEIAFLPGAYVVFFDDITVDQVLKAQEAQNGQDMLSNMDILLGQIVEWNLADDNGPLEVNMESIKRLPLKIITWISETQSEILGSIVDKKKELPSN